MCGIVGVASATERADEGVVRAMRDALVHRGPDDAGLWMSEDGGVALGHRRLSILDLSPAGRQPMAADDGALQIVFNGEIYNYRDLRAELEGKGRRFRSTSDTEVLLTAYAEWGEGCVARLQGMFAFAIYDRRLRRLFLARDRAGEKPLYYLADGRRFLFGSELKALLAHPGVERRIDPAALDAFLASGYVPGEVCILQGARKLPPAHRLTYGVDDGKLSVERYWDLPEPDPGAENRREEDLVEELESRLQDAVRSQMAADVPVGILLSGGIDSSLIAALAARSSGARVRTFTIRFSDGEGFDEGPHAALVARHLGTEHEEMVAEPATVDLLPTLARQVDEPMADSSLVPTYLLSRLVRARATVALGGDGGDELFGGYLHYDRLRRDADRRARLPDHARSLAAAAARNLLPAGLRGRDALLALRTAKVDRMFDAPSRRRLVPGLPAVPGPERPTEASRGFPGSAMADDFRTYLPEDVLVKVDRASMLASLEVRAPFLDSRLVEFAFRSVPNRLRSTASARKILPKRLARKLLPPEMDLARKQGFGAPLHAWDRGPWGDAVRAILRESRDGFFDRRRLGSLLAGRWPLYNVGERLFGLALLELWRREYRFTLR
jgi:asparagine synthase (glutamine-hydrolysing)